MFFKNSEFTLGLKYTTKICFDFKDIALGSKDVPEIFIQSHNVCFNPTVDAFFSKKQTKIGKTEEILIPNSIVEKILEMADLRHELMNLKDEDKGTSVEFALMTKLALVKVLLSKNPSFCKLFDMAEITMEIMTNIAPS